MGSCQSTPAAAPARASEAPAPSPPTQTNQGVASATKTNGASAKASSDASTDTHHTNGSATSPGQASARQTDLSSVNSGKATTQKHALDLGRSNSDENSSNDGSAHSQGSQTNRSVGNPKSLAHSTSAIGLDSMIETRREEGDLKTNVVHMEVPFGRPIEEVYDGVHNGPVLGSGISGLVRLVTHKATGVKYAVKCLDLGLVETSEGLQQLREEIFIMCQLDHPNIVRLEEVYESHSEIYLVQELCLGGELFDRLDEQPDYHYTEAECARLVKQMLSAVRYLHLKGIIHRDLKLENFLFSSTSPDSELKMIDFGLSKHFKFGEVHHDAVGTPYTVAPEVISGEYDERCDIWAIGVITFLLLSGDPPFGGCGGPEPLMTVRSNILRGAFSFEPQEIWADVSVHARGFIKELLVTDPDKRPTAQKAQNHKWLKEWASKGKSEGDKVLNPNVVEALVSFKEFSDMRKLLCEVLSFTLLPDQIKDLRKEFEKMDTDGSGEISLAALKTVLMTNAGAGSLGALTEEEVEDIFNAMRVKKSETRIHWHEFIAAGLSQCQVDDRNLRLAFDRLDSDHKGYITLDDIMDLMGNDALQSEEAMRRMWGDSIKAVQCQHARITYDDFLLLMKGQTKEADLECKLKTLGSSQLLVVPELGPGFEDGGVAETKKFIRLPSGDAVTMDGTIVDGGMILSVGSDHHRGVASQGGDGIVQPSAASMSPLFKGGRAASFEDLDEPLSFDDDLDCSPGAFSGFSGFPGSVASLTPPQTPVRGAEDYVTPMSGRRLVPLAMEGNVDVPELPVRAQFKRIRSRSVGDDKDGAAGPNDADDEKERDAPVFAADARRAMLLPEHDHTQKEIDDLVKDESKSALVVNRQLYRAHRQMRLAVLEASKRFEEQQARRARDIILAHQEAEDSKNGDGMGMIQAGLVMRHGHNKQVSSEAIRKILEQNKAQQQALVEKANKRGGRGRRTRKKTISDMSGMLGSSMGQDELARVSVAAAVEDVPGVGGTHSANAEMADLRASLPDNIGLQPVQEDGSHIIGVTPQTRGATIPGEFRKTKDPFGKDGRYGTFS